MSEEYQIKPSDYYYCKKCNRDIHPHNCTKGTHEEYDYEWVYDDRYLGRRVYKPIIKQYYDIKCPTCGSILKSKL